MDKKDIFKITETLGSRFSSYGEMNNLEKIKFWEEEKETLLQVSKMVDKKRKQQSLLFIIYIIFALISTFCLIMFAKNRDILFVIISTLNITLMVKNSLDFYNDLKHWREVKKLKSEIETFIGKELKSLKSMYK